MGAHPPQKYAFLDLGFPRTAGQGGAFLPREGGPRNLFASLLQMLYTLYPSRYSSILPLAVSSNCLSAWLRAGTSVSNSTCAALIAFTIYKLIFQLLVLKFLLWACLLQSLQ